MPHNKVDSNMSNPVVTVNLDTPMSEAMKLMEKKKIRHLPVLRADGKLTGILSDRDVKRAMDPEYPSFSPNAVAGDFMSWPVIRVDKATPLAKSVKLMIDQKISAIVVTSAGTPAGIVTSEDMLRVLYDLLLHEGSEGKLAILDFTYEPVWREMMRTASAVGI